MTPDQHHTHRPDQNPFPNDKLILAAAGIGATVLALALLPMPQSIWATVLGWLMVAISISDARRFIVPDLLSLPAIPAGLLASGYLGNPIIETLANPPHLAGMAVGVISFLAIRQGYSLLRGHEGLGLGDVKLAAVAGAWTGLSGLLHVVLAASITALFVTLLFSLSSMAKQKSTELTATTAVPFGAFLAPAIWLVYLLQSIG